MMPQAQPTALQMVRAALDQVDALRADLDRLLRTLETPAAPLRHRKADVTWHALQRCVLLHERLGDTSRVAAELQCTPKHVRDILKVARQPATVTSYLRRRLVSFTLLHKLLQRADWDAGAVATLLADVAERMRRTRPEGLRRPERSAITQSHIDRMARLQQLRDVSGVSRTQARVAAS